jgi:hypothetical protein
VHHGGLVELRLYLPKAVGVQLICEGFELVAIEVLGYDLGRKLVLLVLLLTWMDVGRMDEKKEGRV